MVFWRQRDAKHLHTINGDRALGAGCTGARETRVLGSRTARVSRRTGLRTTSSGRCATLRDGAAASQDESGTSRRARNRAAGPRGPPEGAHNARRHTACDGLVFPCFCLAFHWVFACQRTVSPIETKFVVHYTHVSAISNTLKCENAKSGRVTKGFCRESPSVTYIHCHTKRRSRAARGQKVPSVTKAHGHAKSPRVTKTWCYL